MPPRRTTRKTLGQAHSLRQKPTEPEAKLWLHLRTLRGEGIHFRRQHAIGKYVADFCAPRQHLIVELDGSQHLKQAGHVEARTAYVRLRGYRVLRFGDGAVMNDPDGVMRAILAVLRVK